MEKLIVEDRTERERERERERETEKKAQVFIYIRFQSVNIASDGSSKCR